jgi:hypothetical protein
MAWSPTPLPCTRPSGNLLFDALIRDEAADLVIVSRGDAVEAGTSDGLSAVIGGGTPVLIVPSGGRDRSAKWAAEPGQHG